MNEHRIDSGFPPMEYDIVMYRCPERGRTMDLIHGSIRDMKYCPLCGELLEDIEIERIHHDPPR